MKTIHSTIYSLVVASLILVGGTNASFAEDAKIGVVGNVTGDVTATNSSGAERTLIAGSPVYLNDMVVSDANAKAQIMFLDKSALMINPNTIITVDRFVFDPATASGDLSIKSAKGALRFIGGALSKTKPVQIKTPVATIGIRGGIADVAIGANNATDAVKRFGDELTMKNLNGDTQTITANNQGLTAIDGRIIPTPPARIDALSKDFGAAPATGGQGTDNDNSTNDAGGDNAPATHSDGEAVTPAKGDEGGQGGDDNSGTPGAQKGKDGTPAGKPAQNADGGPRGKPADPKGVAQGTGSTKGDANGPAPRPNMNTAGHQSEPAGSFAKAPTPAPRPNMNTAGHQGGPVGSFVKVPTPAPTNLANVNIPLGDATQGTQRVEGSTTFQNRVTTPTHTGLYALSNSSGALISAGRSEFADNGERLNGRLVQGFPNPVEGPRFTGSLPSLRTSGYQFVGDANLDGHNVAGDAYRTADSAMSYYSLNGANGTHISTVVGRRVDANQWSSVTAASGATGGNTNTAGLSFYNFLPDLVGFDYNQHSFFNHGIADTRLDRLGEFDGGLGLVVDWNKGRFITGQLNWDADGSTGLHRDLVLGFGKTLSNGKLLDGKTYESLSYRNLNGYLTSWTDDGFLRADDGYSPTDTSRLSGFMLEGIQPDDSTLGSNAAFAVGTQGPRTFQGAVQGGVQDIGTSTSNTKKGFAAGFIRTKTTTGGTNGAPIFKSYGNNDIDDVTITPNVSDGTLSAHLKLENTASGTGYVEGHFGTGGAYTADSAYITDDLYAAQANKYRYNNGISTTDHVNGAANNSVIVAASQISDIAGCSSCEHVSWGVWAGDISRSASGAPVQIVDTAELIPYVSGTVTQDLNTNTQARSFGRVDYTGAMIGSTLNNGILSRQEGSFIADIDLDNRQLRGFDGRFGGMNFGTKAAHAIGGSGDAVFSNITVHNLDLTVGSGAITGAINGALFGSQAQNIGGNFAVQQAVVGSAQTINASGVYLGTR